MMFESTTMLVNLAMKLTVDSGNTFDQYSDTSDDESDRVNPEEEQHTVLSM